MKRLPLSQLNVKTHSNLIIPSLSFDLKPTCIQNPAVFSDASRFKHENIIDLENSTDFLDLKPCEHGSLFDRIDRDMESPLSSPRNSSSPKSSIAKKSIKKLKDQKGSIKLSQKLKDLLRLKRQKQAQGHEKGIQSQPALNVTYKYSPKKLISQLMEQADKEQEMRDLEELDLLEEQRYLIENETELSTSSSQMKFKQDNLKLKPLQILTPADKNIYCLNTIPDSVTKLQISGLSVFLGDDCHTYSFPMAKKTKKYVV